jgi:hypothetical protein
VSTFSSTHKRRTLLEVKVSKQNKELFCTATECIVRDGSKTLFSKDSCGLGVALLAKKAQSRTLAEALTDNRSILDIKGQPSVPALSQFCYLR